jgi:hypothetical protein
MLDRTDDILRHFPTLLRRWDGSIARMWCLPNFRFLKRKLTPERIAYIFVGLASVIPNVTSTTF